MPSDNIELQQNIELILKTEGFEDVVPKMKAILREQKNLGNSSGDLIKKYGGVKEATNALIAIYKTKGSIARKELSQEQKAVGSLSSSYDKLGLSIKEIGSGLKSLVVPSSFAAVAVGTTDKYNKALLVSSANVNRLGIGLTKLENSLDRTSSTISLTRMETIKLFDQFQSGMRETSIADFENTMKRMKSIVGSNAQAMEEMQSSLSAISQEYPSISRGLLDIAAADSMANEAQKESLKNRIRNLYFIGKISDAQYKQVSKYLSGNQQISSSDSKKQEELKEQIKATQELQRQMEYLKLAVGKAILPALVKISKIFITLTKGAESFAGSMKNVGRILAVGMVAKGIGSFLGGKGGGGGGGGGKGGGGIGGALAGIVGGAGSPVFVTNWPPSLGPVETFRSVAAHFKQGGADKLGLGGGLKAAGRDFIGGSYAPGMGKMAKFGQFAKSKAMTTTAVGSYVGSIVLGGLSEKFKEKGMKKSSGAAGLGASALSILGGAATGAKIGAIFGPWGAAIGAATGGLFSLAKETGNLKKNFIKLIGIKEKPGKFQKEFEEGEKKEEDRIEKERELQEKIETAGIENLKNIKTKGFGVVYKEVRQKDKEAQEALSKSRHGVNKEIVEKMTNSPYSPIGSDIKFKTGSTEEISGKMFEQEKKVSNLRDKMASDKMDMDEDELEKAEEYIIKEENKLSFMKKIVKEAEDTNKEYQKALTFAANTAGQLQGIILLQQMQKRNAEVIGELYNTQSQTLEAIIRKTSILGGEDTSEAQEALKRNIKLLDEKVAVHKELLSMIEDNKEATIEDTLAQEGLSDAAKGTITEWQKAGAINIADTVVQTKMEELRKVAVTQMDSETKARLSLLGMHEKSLELQTAEAQQAQLQVQLADNFAISVKAGADMRLKAFLATGDVIAKQKELLAVVKAGRIQFEEKWGVKNVEMRAKELEIENKITQEMISQAEQVKTLRDGWVSAISAMNTGFGGFTEIVMDANKNVAQMNRLSGSVRSEKSGAFTREGEKPVGFGQSSRFSAVGGNTLGISNITGPLGNEVAYTSQASEKIAKYLGVPVSELTDPKAFEGMASQQAQGFIQEQARRGAGGTGQPGANPFAKSEYIGRDRMESSVVNGSPIGVVVNLTYSDAERVGRAVTKELNKKLNKAIGSYKKPY